MLGRFRLGFLLCFITLTMAFYVQAEPRSQVLKVSASNAENYPVYPYLNVLEDPQKNLTITSLLSGDHREHFVRVTQTPPNYGLTKSAYWFRIKVKNFSKSPLSLFLELQNPRMQNVQLYVVDKTKLIKSEIQGIAQPFNKRELRYRNPVFDLSFPAGEERTLYLRTETRTLHLVPLVLMKPQSFFEHKRDESYLLGIFIGILIFAACYNLMLYFSIKNKTYLFYIGYVCGFLAYQTSMDGLAYQYLWPDSPQWGLIAPLILVMFSLVCAFYFTMSFLTLKSEIPQLYGLLKKLAIMLMILGFIPFIAEYQLATKIISVTGWMSILMLLITGVFAYKKHIHMARFYLLAWSVLLVSILVSELRFWGISSIYLYGGHVIKIGAVIEVFLLSAALGDRINNIRKKVIKSQEETIRLQKDFTQNLELEVRERTEELEIANKQLKVLSTTDGLSQLYNRRYFDERLNAEWLRLSEMREPLALIMCDIDYFKMYNDTYGHPKGDTCIQSVAKILKTNTRSSETIVARYGGEEFIIACPQCGLSDAHEIAERIRREVVSAAIPHSGSKVCPVVSLSIGVAAAIPCESEFPSRLISLADHALYMSKESGRNMVTSSSCSSYEQFADELTVN